MQDMLDYLLSMGVFVLLGFSGGVCYCQHQVAAARDLERETREKLRAALAAMVQDPPNPDPYFLPWQPEFADRLRARDHA